MRRAARWLFAFIFSAGCLCIVILWTRSYGRVECFGYQRREINERFHAHYPFDGFRIFSLSGSLGVNIFRIDPTIPPYWRGHVEVESTPGDSLGFYPQYERSGFRWWDWRVPLTSLSGPGRT